MYKCVFKTLNKFFICSLWLELQTVKENLYWTFNMSLLDPRAEVGRLVFESYPL